jgi:hypothetical protein
VVFYLNPLDQSETIITKAKTVLDILIIQHVLSMNELLLLTMSTLRENGTAETEKYRRNTKQSQLDTVYSSLQHTAGIPTRDSLSGVSQDDPFEWSPTEAILYHER